MCLVYFSSGRGENISDQKPVLRWAAVKFGVFKSEDVDGAFVTGCTQERGVMAEVDAEKMNTEHETGLFFITSVVAVTQWTVPVEGGRVGSSAQLH